MMKWFQRLDTGLAIAEKIIAVVLFAALALSILVTIVGRNLFHTSFQLLLEMAPSLVLWLAMVGATLALRENRHIRLEVLLRFCPEGFRRGARRLTALFGMAVMGVLGHAAIEFVRNEVALFGARGWLTIAFPIFFAICFFRYFGQLLAPHSFAPAAAAPPEDPSPDRKETAS